MAASSWRYGKRSKYHAKVSQDPEDFYRLDSKKSAAENAYDIYTALCCRDTRDTKRLFLLNALATLCQQQQEQHQHQPQQHNQKQRVWQPRLQQHPHQQHPSEATQGITASTTTAAAAATTTTTATMTMATTAASTTSKTKSSSLSIKSSGGGSGGGFGSNGNVGNNLGFTTEELLYCLSASLIHTFAQVRAAALRTMRYAIITPKDIKIFNSMQLQHLLCRSIDIMLKNDDERVQALKLIRKMLAISPSDVSPVVVRCLVSLADSGAEDSDNMLRACLATLCEFAVLNPTLLVVCGGVTSITRNVLECHNPRIAESLCGVLLYLLEWPQTRSISGVSLDCLAAPYCDFTYRLGIMDKNKDARELRYTSCRLALLSILRSWTGTIEFCDPSKPSGLKAIVDALYLNQIEVRKAILDLLYELLGLPQPAWTEDYIVALQAIDPSDFQDSWLLSNGFVAMEGRCILPSLAARAPNVSEQHLSLLLYCFLETGLLNALVEVVAAEDKHLSVRTTVLIAKILQLMHKYLPADICSTSPALPTLVSHATQGNQHAMAAISALQSYQKMLRNRPAACSLFLDSIIQSGALVQTRLFRREISSQDQSPWQQTLQQMYPLVGGTLDRQRLDSVSSSENDSASQSSSSHRSSFRLKRLLPFLENLRANRLIKESNVLTISDGFGWDWEVVITILRSGLIRKLDDTTAKFLKHLVHFFKPSSNRFSHQDLVQPVPVYVTAGLDLIDWLLSCKELESMRILTDYFSDVSQHLLAVTTSNRAHDCLFSPQHMINTMCQQYFLYIGRMCRSQKGISILINTAVFEHLINLVRNSDHICYIKLIVSSLDYRLDSVTRKVLERALTNAKTRNGRLYATQFLIVLLRARIPNFEVWGIRLIIQQTKDSDRAVVLAAMDVLEEACHEKYYLEEIVSLWPNLKPLGDVGRLLMARYYSLPRGLNHKKAKIKEEIEYWKNCYNKRYVLIVEVDTHSSMTLHVRNEDGYYSRRNCNSRPTTVPPNIPPHLYAQMVQTTQGTTSLRKFGDLPHMIEVINCGKCTDESECLELKTAIWTVGHTSTHSNGIDYLTELCPRIYEKLVIMATKCEISSIRSTCFSVLGLIGGTNSGANALFKLNWLSVRHDRNTIWPVHQPEDWMSNSHTPVRHPFEDMPPYNYTGIEDQIDGSYYTDSYWNLILSSSSTTKEGGASASSEAQDGNTTVDSSKTGGADEVPNKCVTTSARSKTLPETISARYNRHQRSLSESKTTDVISLIAGNTPAPPTCHQHQHRIRYNSCTDSNTSGVSSCESVTGGGRVAGIAGEYQINPLSPIPSMSNLLELPGQQVELMRRTTMLGTTYVAYTLSPMYIRGYAQLRSLRKHCRPVLSESSAELYDYIDRNVLVSTSDRPRKSSFAEKRMKVRSLDRQSSLRMFSHLDVEEMQVPLPSFSAPKFSSVNDSQGPCYAGICLPKNLMDLFPTKTKTRSYVLRDIQDQDFVDFNLYTAKQQFLNDSLNNEGSVAGGGTTGGDESSVISSLSDVSSASKRSKWLGARHGRNNCLYCSRARRNRTQQRLDTEINAACDMYTNASAALVAAGLQAAVALSRKIPKPQTQSKTNAAQAQGSSAIQLSDISFNSPESILSEESLSDKVTAHILYNVQRLANPVSAKQSKMTLLELKQKHPNSFQDICLYSEVCKTIGRSSYRMNARRFLQELFFDLNLDTFYNEPLEILSRKEKELEKFYAEHAIEHRLSGEFVGILTVAGNTSIEHAGPICGSSSGNIISNNNGQQSGTAASFASSTHKPHLKSQPLASVYETSCENLLLEQSPRLQDLKDVVGAKGGGSKIDLKNSRNSKLRTTALISSSPYRNELRITSDDDDDDDDDNEKGTEKTKKRLQYKQQPIDKDEVDSLMCLRHAASSCSQTSAYSSNPASVTTPTQISSSSFNATSSSNCSDQTSNSNRSSICTISHHPVNVSVTNTQTNMTTTPASTTGTATANRLTTSLENENKKYTRGRFYTLELDLSCTKNKFPIRDRTRSGSSSSNGHTVGSTTSQPIATRPMSLLKTTDTSLTSTPSTKIAKSSIKPSDLPLKPADISQQSRSITFNIHRSPLIRHSYGCDATQITNTNDISLTHDEDLSPTSPFNSTGMYAITKSLAASLAKPIGSLYCEKRLQSAKSEAVLTNVAAVVTTTTPLAATATTTAKASSTLSSTTSLSKGNKDP